MSDNPRCRCARCTIRSLVGPAVIVTVGILFLLQQSHSGRFDFGNTYPVILVVIGAILLASALAPMDGHIDPTVPQQVPPPPPVAPGATTTQTTYQSPYTGQGQ